MLLQCFRRASPACGRIIGGNSAAAGKCPRQAVAHAHKIEQLVGPHKAATVVASA
jgi:hypothetical protein